MQTDFDAETGLTTTVRLVPTDPGSLRLYGLRAAAELHILGPTFALKDGSANHVAPCGYAGFGEGSVTGSSANANEYTGRENDGTGVDYYRARYCEPALGRLLNETRPSSTAAASTSTAAQATTRSTTPTRRARSSWQAARSARGST